MPKYEVWKTVTTDWMVVIEAENPDDLMDAIADGVEWEFVEGDENIDDIVLLDENADNSLLVVGITFKEESNNG